MKEVLVTWEELEKACVRLASQLEGKVGYEGLRYTTMVCVARGGLIVGGILQHLLHLSPRSCDYYYVHVRQYADKGGKPSSPGRELAPLSREVFWELFDRSDVLWVDDIVDTGKTLKGVAGGVAAAFWKPNSSPPTYIGETRDPKLWLKMPWEALAD